MMQRDTQARRARRVALLIALLAAAAQAPAVAAPASFAVRFRSADTVYLDDGAAAGLVVGDRLVVERAGKRVGEVEVIYVAEHSASCRILNDDGAIDVGDRATRDGTAAVQPGGEAAPPPPTETRVAPPPRPAPSYTPPPARRPSTRVSGSFGIDWETFRDQGPAGLDSQRATGRLNLRVRDIGGSAYQLRIRLRGQQIRRDRSSGDPRSETDSRNRLYEAALTWAPEGGRFAYQVGRIGTSPFIGIGFLDGVLGQMALGSHFQVGAFFGSRPLIEEFGFQSYGQKYGLFTRFLGLADAGGRPGFEMTLAGVREEGKVDVSREYVALETRYAPGGRWSLFQRAEIDINSGWRKELSGKSSQLSNVSLSLLGRLSAASRVSISYDRTERYLTEESRTLAEELFDDLLRQGLRASLVVGRPGHLSFSFNGGLRRREGDNEGTYSFGLGVRHPNVASWGLALGADTLAFSNPFTEGVLLNTRAAKRFGGGNEVSLTLGGQLTRDRHYATEDRVTEWVRLGSWFELPHGLFAHGELEVTAGDDLEGQRVIVGIGYRF